VIGNVTNFAELEHLEMLHCWHRVNFDVVDDGMVEETTDSYC
jgi:hypothetical protein